MTTSNPEYLLKPRSIVLIGASAKPRSVGGTVMRNLLDGGYSGTIMPVNLRYEAVNGVPAYQNIYDLTHAPDLAIIVTGWRCAPAA